MYIVLCTLYGPPDMGVFTVRHARTEPPARDRNICEQTGRPFVPSSNLPFSYLIGIFVDKFLILRQMLDGAGRCKTPIPNKFITLLDQWIVLMVGEQSCWIWHFFIHPWFYCCLWVGWPLNLSRNRAAQSAEPRDRRSLIAMDPPWQSRAQTYAVCRKIRFVAIYAFLGARPRL